MDHAEGLRGRGEDYECYYCLLLFIIVNASIVTLFVCLLCSNADHAEGLRGKEG